jgi:1-acyl-sn-glycerol-3-phosphate acyltransferase
VQVRAQRRVDQIRAGAGAGAGAADLHAIAEAIVARDHQDSSRRDGPLVCTEDAHRIDTSAMTIDQVLDCLEAIVQGKVGAADRAGGAQLMGTDSKPQQNLSRWRVAWWHLWRAMGHVLFFLVYRYRAWGQKEIPTDGPLLILSNHQSFLDPLAVGAPCNRRHFYSMARATLFKHPILGWFFSSLCAIPIDQEAGDLKAMRICIDVLKRGQALLVFPEGTRCSDGQTHAFASGVLLLIKRSGATVLPAAVEGTFAIWPMGQKRPRFTGRIGVMYGKPIAAEELLAMAPDAALKHLQQTVEELRQDIAGKLDV